MNILAADMKKTILVASKTQQGRRKCRDVSRNCPRAARKSTESLRLYDKRWVNVVYLSLTTSIWRRNSMRRVIYCAYPMYNVQQTWSVCRWQFQESFAQDIWYEFTILSRKSSRVHFRDQVLVFDLRFIFKQVFKKKWRYTSWKLCHCEKNKDKFALW